METNPAAYVIALGTPFDGGVVLIGPFKTEDEAVEQAAKYYGVTANEVVPVYEEKS